MQAVVFWVPQMLPQNNAKCTTMILNTVKGVIVHHKTEIHQQIHNTYCIFQYTRVCVYSVCKQYTSIFHPCVLAGRNFLCTLMLHTCQPGEPCYKKANGNKKHLEVDCASWTSHIPHLCAGSLWGGWIWPRLWRTLVCSSPTWWTTRDTSSNQWDASTFATVQNRGARWLCRCTPQTAAILAAAPFSFPSCISLQLLLIF